MADATPLKFRPTRIMRKPVLDVDVRVSCSSGTYIRALARDLGAKLGVGGYLTRLRRTRVGRYALPDDASGCIGAKVDRERVITAHTERKTFTNREGETITRNRAVLDTPYGQGAERTTWVLHHLLSMLEAAQGAILLWPLAGRKAWSYASTAVSAGGESGHRSLCSLRCERAERGRRRGHHRPRQCASGQTDYRVPRVITAWNATCYSGCGAT